VFQNNNISKAQEIELESNAQNKNLQNMPLLLSTLAPKVNGSSTDDVSYTAKTLGAISEGKALSNENTALTQNGETVVQDVTSDQISLYTVRKGDRIEQVAKMFGVNVNTILWANDLKKGEVLQEDQVLVILPISSIKYVVKKGDSLASIARYYRSDLDEIAQFNNLDTDSNIKPGDEIIIPDAEGSLAEAENKRLAEQDAKNKAAAKSKSKTSKAAKDDRLIGGGAINVDTTGYFARPITGGVKSQGLHGHNGVDLTSYYNAPILAAASGKVIVAKVGGWGGGYGNYVVIQHNNGTQTLYGHMSEVLVQVGQAVSKGQQIGKMGSTGQSTGVHLHFEVRGGKNPF
jgi:LysM repeat protein